jgi:predicted Zn-dependent peptidase
VSRVVTTAPVVEPSADWHFPVPRDEQLGNGVRVLAYHCPGQYVVAASLYFDSPLEAEPRDKEGIAGLVGRCITKGAAGRSAEQFADALALCGADLEGSASADGFAVRLAVPATHLEEGLGLLADAVGRADFPQDEVEHERSLRLEEIDQARAYPQHAAVETLNAAVFGAARAGRLAGGDVDTVTTLTRDDVVAYSAAQLRTDDATLVIAGDFHDIDPVVLASDALGGWTSPSGAATVRSTPVLPDQPTVLLVDWPDAPQTTIRLAGAGLTRSDSRWPAMFVANHAVGGSFSSRLNSVLREAKGLTYGVSSGLDSSRTTGLFTVATAVRGDAGAEAVADILAILRSSSGAITDDEVTTGARAATESAALGFERAEAVVGRVEMLLGHRLPLGHVDANLARIRQVTTTEVNAAYATVLDPERLTVVLVGDAGALRAPLADLGYAEVSEVTSARR